MPYNLLYGKKGIIFGALDEKSIAWQTATRVHEEGEFVLTNAPVAAHGRIMTLRNKFASDSSRCSNTEDLENLIDQSIKILVGRSTCFTLNWHVSQCAKESHIQTKPQLDSEGWMFQLVNSSSCKS